LFSNCPNLTDVIVNDSVIDGSIIPDKCFYKSAKLRNVTLAEGFKYIGENAFTDTSIVELIMPDTITKVAKNFLSNVPNLETLVLSKTLTTLSGESISKPLIHELGSLKRITLPYLTRNLPDTFVGNCPSLEEYILPDGYASYGEENGEINIVLHLDKSEMDSHIEQNEGYKPCDGYVVEKGVVYSSNFDNIIKAPCAIESIELPETITMINDAAFSYCAKLSEINLPNNNITFGTWCFHNSGIEELVIPDNVTTIANNALSTMTKLRKLVFGSGVKSIGTGVANNNNLVDTIVFKSMEAPEIKENTFKTGGGYRLGTNAKDKKMYINLDSVLDYSSGYWTDLIASTDNWTAYTITYITLDLFGKGKTVTLTLYYNGDKYLGEEVYLVRRPTGEKVTCMKNGDTTNYKLLNLSELYVGVEYALLITINGQSYTLPTYITIEDGKYDYEFNFKTSDLVEFHDPTAIMSMSLDDEIGVGISNNATKQMVSKYEYDVLAARIAYLESLLK
jgi:hypothetical protein